MRHKLLFVPVFVFGVMAALIAWWPQSVLAQTSCTEAPVNVEFRQWTGTETAWTSGASFTPAQNSYIDVNCFAKNGTALLTSGKLAATVVYQGQTTIVSQSTWTNQVRRYQVTRPGTYTFTCSRTGTSCTNSDSFVVTGTLPAPTPSPTPAAQVTPTPAASTQPIVSTCAGIAVEGGATPTVGSKVKFRCSGPSNASTYFFAYRRSTADGMTQLQTEAGSLSTEIEISPFMQVQCNPCIGTTCATAQNVNEQCTFTQNAQATTPPAAGSIADLNKDGKVDIDDYRLFLQEYLKFVRK